MRLILIGVLAVLAIVIIIAGLKNRGRVSLFAVFLMVAPGGALGYFEYQWQTAQDEITAVVKEVSGNNDAVFKCERITHGFFDVWAKTKAISDDPNVVYPKYKSCADILSWYHNENKGSPTKEQIVSLHLLSTETMRVSGQTSPPLQECLAMKNDPVILTKLGATANQANYMTLYYIQNINSKLKPEFKGVFC
jgi:hypothetical protein